MVRVVVPVALAIISAESHFDKTTGSAEVTVEETPEIT
jgi:hypothetical protein